MSGMEHLHATQPLIKNAKVGNRQMVGEAESGQFEKRRKWIVITAWSVILVAPALAHFFARRASASTVTAPPPIATAQTLGPPMPSEKADSMPQSSSTSQASPLPDSAESRTGTDGDQISGIREPAQDDSSQQNVANDADARKLNAQALQMLSANPPDVKGARSTLETAAILFPSDIEIQNNLGYVYNRTGDYFDAESVLLRVVNADPTRRVAYRNLGYAEAKLGNSTLAANHFCQYIRLFISPEQGKSTLARVMKDPDVIVQDAVLQAMRTCTR